MSDVRSAEEFMGTSGKCTGLVGYNVQSMPSTTLNPAEPAFSHGIGRKRLKPSWAARVHFRALTRCRLVRGSAPSGASSVARLRPLTPGLESAMLLVASQAQPSALSQLMARATGPTYTRPPRLPAL